MGGRLDEGSSKRRRRNAEKPPRKQHLYLALDDWEGGYSIHKLDADIILDDIGDGGEHKLPEPAAIRIKTPVYGRMIFTALGTTIFIDTNPHNRGDNAPPTFVYDTETAALTVGPRIPRGIDGLSTFMAASEKLYALTSVDSPDHPCVQALSWARTATDKIWEPDMDWSWSRVRSSQPRCHGIDVVSYALHPDGHTIFMSTYKGRTYTFDTSTGEWKELGNDWVLPFRGRAFFDAQLNAWVGIDRKEAGYVCCCQIASRSATTRRPLECRVLKEKLFRFNNEEKYKDGGRYMKATLTYMGDSRFCLVENILRSEEGVDDGTVLHVTLFGLKYDHMGELRTKLPCGTKSYAVSKNNAYFSHAAFWM
ncbi:uncharacterized protein LOC124672637 [Lolium rigidum]|uniref:uncharacterized protein LOC124672637 n=1 Tax=Lolium rigidum TaxID=89674 RepID=UPI001F5CC0D0|nr:uncharacterized protein LOC124672637 [Lolium rigidum]